ncbi:hypothetical protein B0187_08505 [Haemophilus paracuniculus]|uniref:DUF3761 domain-containing protein n=2 Tax=Haemophilus paracuniculus TaxID=734 RepID=A0A1T0ART7_9PAST|nr:hypothetical protein B0187_08505 [Haemophilus paracuniculus]
MKKGALSMVAVAVVALSGCVRQGVAVAEMPAQQAVKSPDTSLASLQANLPKANSQTLPKEARIVCRDGSYSTQNDPNVCLGRGGVAFENKYYFSE